MCTRCSLPSNGHGLLLKYILPPVPISAENVVIMSRSPRRQHNSESVFA